MTARPDPERLVTAWLDEAVPTFPASRFSQVMAEVRGETPRRAAGRRAPWVAALTGPWLRRAFAATAVLGALLLALAFLPRLSGGLGVTGASPTPSPLADLGSSTRVRYRFVTGTPRYTGTTPTWLLVGRADPAHAGRLSSVPQVLDITLDVSDDGTFRFMIGCREFDGTYHGLPDPGTAVPARLIVGQHRDDPAVCEPAVGEEELVAVFDSIASVQLAQTGPGATELDVDPELRSLLDGTPGLGELLFLDRQGEPLLLFATAEEVPTGGVIPESSLFEGQILRTGDVPLAGTAWLVAGQRAHVGTQLAPADPDNPAVVQVTADGRVLFTDGCTLRGGGLRDGTQPGARIPAGATPFWPDPLDVGPTDCTSGRVAAQVFDAWEALASAEVVRNPVTAVEATSMQATLRDQLAALEDVRALVGRDAAGTPVLLLLPLDGLLHDDGADTWHLDLDPVPAPFPRLRGGRTLEDDAWMLVGRRDAEGHLVTTDLARPIRVRFGPGGKVTGDDGCGVLLGTWKADAPEPTTGARALQVSPFGMSWGDGCIPDGREDLYAVDAAFDPQSTAATATVALPDLQATIYGVPRSDVDPWLWAWLQANRDSEHLAITDQDGRTMLVFAPVPAPSPGGD
ncbi:MAG: hypothetical protein U0869_08720 [Chloroflexota bacterium]